MVRIIVLFWGLCLFIQGCSQETKTTQSAEKEGKLASCINTEVIEILTDPDKVTQFKVLPSQRNTSEKKEAPFTKSGEEIELDHSQIDEIKKLVLSDSSYYFNMKKSCPFVPDIGLRFTKKKDVIVLISFMCNQIKFIYDGKDVLLDCDPMLLELEKRLKKNP